MMMRWMLALLTASLLVVPASQADEEGLLDEVKARQAVEAQRVEKEFASQRAAAYKLVRSSEPKTVEAVEKLQTLLAMLRADVSLEPRRREVLLATVQFDLNNVRQIAAQKRRQADQAVELAASRAIRQDRLSPQDATREDEARRLSNQAKSVIDARSRTVAEARADRFQAADRLARVMRGVDDSAVPEARDYTLPKDWLEKSKRRSAAIKMTEKEKALMRALASIVEVDFNKNSFEEVIDYFRKSLQIDIAVDRRALEEASVSYESQITLKLRGSARTVIKRLLADLNLAYVIKDEALQITSRERASQMTTTRAYYIGDLVTVLDLRVPPLLSQLAMIETVNRIIAMVQQQVEPQSWRSNNPDAAGVIVFDPLSMSLVIKQTAEVHFLLGSSLGR